MWTPELIARLPKTDLHVHLDGSLRESTLIELAADAGLDLPSNTPEGLNELVFKDTYANLEEYLHGFAFTCASLQTPEALERAAYELAWDNIDEGVRYIEVRFAPQLHMGPHMDFDTVLSAVNRGLVRAMSEHEQRPEIKSGKEPPFRYGIIVCAMRMFTAGFSAWYRGLCEHLRYAPHEQVFGMASLELARASVGCRDKHGVPIVGFDLAGHEAGYPAHDHRTAYDYIHQHFMKKTVHAGEAYGPESIFAAITALHADRIGHGYHLFSSELCGPDVRDPEDYCQRLSQYIADRRVTIEVCITSNMQTNPGIGDVKNHVFGRMLDERLSATLCTDNRLVSHTTVSRELTLAIEAFDMTPAQVHNTLVYGFKRGFYPGTYLEKRAYVRQVLNYLDTVMAELPTSSRS